MALYGWVWLGKVEYGFIWHETSKWPSVCPQRGYKK
jgi:hypothetical protein